MREDIRKVLLAAKNDVVSLYRTRFKNGVRISVPDVRMRKHTKLDLKLPCKCGGYHNAFVSAGPNSHSAVIMRTYARETPECGAIISIREVVAFYEAEGLAPKSNTTPARRVGETKQVELHERSIVRIMVETPIAFMKKKRNKRQPVLGVPRQLKAQEPRLTIPRQEGMTPYEWAHYQDLLRRYPEDEGYLVLKVGGTPDFHVFKMLWVPRDGGVEDWVTELLSECKGEGDAYADRTQAIPCRGLENRNLLGLVSPPIESITWGYR